MSTPGRVTVGPTTPNEPDTMPERERERERRTPEPPVATDAIAADAVDADVVEGEKVEGAMGAAARTANEAAAPLFSRETSDDLWRRWDTIQAGFVDEPRRAVQDADALVDDIVKRLADSFAHARTRLEQHWDRGDSVSTEDLRLALQQYRSFFKRLLAV
jgi:hypothetical protein